MAENILVFCAHSDDQILGPGATLAKYAKEGKNVYTVIFTFGESALIWLKKGIAIKTRIQEAKKADRVIHGKGVEFLGLEEAEFAKKIQEKEYFEKIKQIIRAKHPSKIFTHSPEDPHPLHRLVCKKVLEALDSLKLKADVYCFDIWNPFTIRKSHLPKMYVDISDTFSTKTQAIKCFPSQWPSIFSLLWSVHLRARIHGFHINAKYAERFFKLR